jgi:streptomycin 6-kinase
MPDWTVPSAFVEANADDPVRLGWAAAVPRSAARLAEEWSLTRTGPARAGHMGVVWPVRDADDRALVLKLGCEPAALAAEADALRAWSGSGIAVGVEHTDAEAGAVLLERLDASRDLTTVADADEATAVIADLLARSATAAPSTVPDYRVEADRVRAAIEEHRAVKGGVVPAFAVDSALETLAELAASPDARLLHFDAHYLNVLHTLPGAADPGWRLIDPLPHAGPPEIEPVAALRNRFDDALATGDPDRALRRRLDVLVDRLGLDPGLARRTAHAVAVDNLLWLLPERAGHQFVEPYRLVLGWGG